MQVLTQPKRKGQSCNALFRTLTALFLSQNNISSDPPERKYTNKENIRNIPQHPKQTTKHTPEAGRTQQTGHATNPKFDEYQTSKQSVDHSRYSEELDRPSSNESGISVSSGRLFRPSPLDSHRSFQSPRSPANVNLRFPYRKDLNDF